MQCSSFNPYPANMDKMVSS